MSRIVERIAARGANAAIAPFRVGDTVDVHVRIVEGDKERTQVFTGTVIGVRGSRTQGNFTVRRIVQGEGVERKFPFASPRVEKVAVRRTGRARRAKLNYLRERTGKATRLAERMDYVEGTDSRPPEGVAPEEHEEDDAGPSEGPAGGGAPS